MDAWIVPGHGEVLKQLSVGKCQNTQVNRKLTRFEGLPNKYDTLNTQGLFKNGYLPIIVSQTYLKVRTLLCQAFSPQSLMPNYWKFE